MTIPIRTPPKVPATIAQKILVLMPINEHKNQAAAWKLLMDRMLPVAAFEKDVKGSSGKSSININITGVGQVDIPEQPIEAEFEEVETFQD